MALLLTPTRMAKTERIDIKTRLRIAAHLRCKIAEMGLSQRAAADMIGVDEATVGRVVNYGAPIGLDLVLGIHRGLHLDANRLFDVDPPREFFRAPAVSESSD